MPREQGEKLAKDLNMMFIETKTLDRELTVKIKSLVRRVIKDKYPIESKPVVNLVNKQVATKDSCF